MRKELIIVGAGGLAKMVIDALKKTDTYEIIGVFVDNFEIGTVHPIGLPVLGALVNDNYHVPSNQFFIVAIGDQKLKASLTEHYSLFLKQAIILHPSAVIAQDVLIGKGSIILAGTTINSGCTIGENCLINSGVVIDHDCNIGHNSHLKIGTLVSSKTILQLGFQSSVGQII